MLLKNLDPKLRGLIIQTVRRWFTMSAKYKEVKKNARVEKPRYNKDKSLSKVPDVYYKCKSCKGLFKDREVQVDHVRTVVALTGSTSRMTLSQYIKQVDCPLENLQVLCKECHKKKTDKENKSRIRTKSNTNRHTGNPLKIKKKRKKKARKLKI